MDAEPKVDLCFHLLGRTLPVDHGFALYGAVSRLMPLLHEQNDVGLKLIRGRYIGHGLLDISPHSDLVLRLPLSRVRDYLRLAGKTLAVSGQSVRVGTPRTRALVPAVVLYTPLATSKNGHDQSRFEAEMRHQMNSLGVQGKLSIGKRRTFQIHGKQVVGYSLLVSELIAEDSIALQEQGLGGRRKMGCGFFEPWKQWL